VKWEVDHKVPKLGFQPRVKECAVCRASASLFLGAFTVSHFAPPADQGVRLDKGSAGNVIGPRQSYFVFFDSSLYDHDHSRLMCKS